MKAFALLLTLGAAFLGGACSQDNVVQQQPKNYRSVSYTAEKRNNDRSQFKQTRGGTVGTGIDLNASNPYKYRTVKAPPRYKYSKPGRPPRSERNDTRGASE